MNSLLDTCTSIQSTVDGLNGLTGATVPKLAAMEREPVRELVPTRNLGTEEPTVWVTVKSSGHVTKNLVEVSVTIELRTRLGRLS